MSITGTGRFPGAFSRANSLTLLPGSTVGNMIALVFFGTPQITLAAAGSVESTLLGTVRLSAWGQAQSGWTLSGSVRSAVVFPETEEANTAVRITLTDITHKVLCLLRGRQDGRSGYEVGLLQGADINSGLAAAEWFAVIRRVVEALPVDEDVGAGATYAVPAGASDTPSSGFCYVNVNTLVAAAQQTTIEARIVDGVIEMRLNDSDVATVEHNTVVTYAPEADIAANAPSPAGSFSAFTAAGWVSSVDGARVLSGSVYALTGQTTSARDILTAVCDGDVWATLNSETIVRAGASVFPSTGRVQLQAFNDVVLMLGPLVGGLARARILDPVRLQVSLWTPTQGTLPGQVANGTTTAQILSLHGTRAVLAAWYGDEQNAGLSAVADGTTSGGYLNFDYASELRGAAYTLASTHPLKLGHPITAWIQFSNTVSIIGCNNSTQSIIGDPLLGLFDTGTVSDSEGINGDQALMLIDNGAVMGHGPSGLVKILTPTSGESMTQGVLVSGMELDPADLLETTIILCRDPLRSWTWLFKTRDDDTANVHLVYDEINGRFVSGRPGFFEQLFRNDIEPTCSALWEGKLVLGCRDGFIRYFVDGVYNDEGADDDYPIEAFVATELITPESMTQDATLSDVFLQLSADSGTIDLRVYGARTASELNRSDRRRILYTKTFDRHMHEISGLEFRAPAMMIELRNFRMDETFTIEGVEAMIGEGNERTGA